MKLFAFLLVLLSPLLGLTQNFTSAEISQWKKQAQQLTIIRDN